jgi:hypothetical protein
MTPEQRRRIWEEIRRRLDAATDRTHLNDLAQPGFSTADLAAYWQDPAALDPHERQTP